MSGKKSKLLRKQVKQHLGSVLKVDHVLKRHQNGNISIELDPNCFKKIIKDLK